MKLTPKQVRKFEEKLKEILPIVQIQSLHYYEDTKKYDNLIIDCLLSHKVNQQVHDTLREYQNSLNTSKFSTWINLCYDENEFKNYTLPLDYKSI